MISGIPLFLGLFNNLAIFIVLAAVYGFLIDYYFQSVWYKKQTILGIVFGIFAICCMYVKIPVAEGVIVDQRNTIVALSGAFGGPLPAFISAITAGIYRIYLGGQGVTGGLIGICLASLAGTGIYYFIDQKENFWKSAGAAFIATIIILPGFLFISDFHKGWELLKAMALPYGSAVFLGILFVGLLLAREDRLHMAEVAQRHLSERLRNFAESASDWFWEIDEECRFTYISERYEKISGLKIRDKTGTRIWEETCPEFHANQWESLQKDLNERKPFKDFEYAFENGEKTIFHIRISGLPVFDPDGKFTGYRGCATDFSKRKQAEEERENLLIQLAQSQKMESVGRLAGGVAHDFNNMLGVILGYSELARMRIDPSDPVYNQLNEIQMAAERSANLTRQLLTFARKQIVEPKVLDLNGRITGMLNMLRRLIGENIGLSWLPGKNLWPVKMDPSQIDQIIANLCVNARDAINGVGKITIETSNVFFDEAYCSTHVDYYPGEYTQLVVSDNGCGIDKETIGRLFEPFFTTKESDKGTGLGLATVYGIVKQNNGFINVYSEPGIGTSFTLYFIRHTDSESIEQIADVSNESYGGSETLLLVEDENALLKLSKNLLEELGYRVITASSPSEAIRLSKFHEAEIQLLVTDVVMPEMNGRDLAEELKTHYPGLKTLFISGYTANIIAHHGILEEGINYLQKPFSKNDLASSIRKALGGK